MSFTQTDDAPQEALDLGSELLASVLVAEMSERLRIGRVGVLCLRHVA